MPSLGAALAPRARSKGVVVIQATDRISEVLAKDERLLDVLVALTPALENLRDLAMRRTMAHRVTVEQAAQIAGVDAAALVEQLNRALQAQPPLAQLHKKVAVVASTPVPPELLATPAELLVDVDVREDLRAGREPFGKIMGAARDLSPDSVLRVRAIFEPAPLYGVFAKKGLAHFTEQIAADDWRIWFYRDASAGAAPAAPSAPAAPDEEDVVIIDVRGLEPPEPMVLTFEALEKLPRGKTLLQINVRVPKFLLPKLEERGFVYEIREQSADLVRLFIRHKSP